MAVAMASTASMACGINSPRVKNPWICPGRPLQRHDVSSLRQPQRVALALIDQRIKSRPKRRRAPVQTVGIVAGIKRIVIIHDGFVEQIAFSLPKTDRGLPAHPLVGQRIGKDLQSDCRTIGVARSIATTVARWPPALSPPTASRLASIDKSAACRAIHLIASMASCTRQK